MKAPWFCATALLLACAPVLACQVDTAAAVRDESHGNYVIPVKVKPGERCVIIDQISAEGIKTRNELWRPVEKIGPSRTRLGRLKREYKVQGDVASVDRYLYIAGQQRGEDSLRFASFPNQTERRAVEYRITIE